MVCTQLLVSQWQWIQCCYDKGESLSSHRLMHADLCLRCMTQEGMFSLLLTWRWVETAGMCSRALYPPRGQRIFSLLFKKKSTVSNWWFFSPAYTRKKEIKVFIQRHTQWSYFHREIKLTKFQNFLHATRNPNFDPIDVFYRTNTEWQISWTLQFIYSHFTKSDFNLIIGIVWLFRSKVNNHTAICSNWENWEARIMCGFSPLLAKHGWGWSNAPRHWGGRGSQRCQRCQIPLVGSRAPPGKHQTAPGKGLTLEQITVDRGRFRTDHSRHR